MTIKRRHASLDGTVSHAVYSDCEKYRYWLGRKFSDKPRRLIFIMLNPSTATEAQNDPTVHRCERRARQNGYGGLTIVNLFAIRSTDPRNMLKADDPVGPENDRFILEDIGDVLNDKADIICGWGVHGTHRFRDKHVLSLLVNSGVTPRALRWTKDGHPSHPLYLPYTAKPHPYEKSGSDIVNKWKQGDQWSEKL